MVPGEGPWETGQTLTHRAADQGAAGTGEGLAGKVPCGGTEGWRAGAAKRQWVVLRSGGSGTPSTVSEGCARAASPVGPAGAVRLNHPDVRLGVCASWLSGRGQAGARVLAGSRR